jgi:hypothetical protein
MAMFPIEGEESFDRLAELMGPDYIDQQIRHAIQFCWRGVAEGATLSR